MKATIWPALAVTVVGALDLWSSAGRMPVVAAAGAPDTPTGAPPEAPRSAMAHLREEVRPGADGTLAIANGSYRASFSAAAGVVYTPRHDDGLEPRLTWRYRARAIATDTATRSLDAVAPAVSASGDHVVDFVRPGLIERYEGERTGVEQIFVLSERPAGRGDVRIVGDVGFGGTIRAKDGGLEFDAGNGLPPFSYAKPVAFDARHTPVPVRVEVDGTSMSLVLDGASLDPVQWPVTIDPLLGVTTIDPGADVGFSDIAYDWRRGAFVVVYASEDAADPDRIDIRMRRYHDFGDPVGPSTTIHAGDGRQRDDRPKIACDLHTDRCLIVWESQQTTYRVRAQLVTGAGDLVGSLFSPGPGAVDGFYSTHERSPSVVARNFHEHTLQETAFVVTWRENVALQFDYVQYARIAGDGTVLGENHFTGYPATVPAPLTYDPHTDRALTAWSDGSGLWMRTITMTGALGTPVLVTSRYAHSIYVAYDRASRRHLITWGELTPDVDWYVKGRIYQGGASPTANGPAFVFAPGHDPSDLVAPLALVAQNGTFLFSYADFENGLVVRLLRLASDGAVISDIAVPPSEDFSAYAIGQQQYIAGAGGAQFGNRGRWAPSAVHGGPADFDGDGKADLMFYRPAVGQFFVRKSSIPPNSQQQPIASYALGGPGHLPARLDWDGDGLTDLAVFSTLSGRWTIRLSSTGTTEVVPLGKAGDVPVPGDYLGDEADEIGVFRESTGEWLIRQRGSSSVTTAAWGAPGDQPVPADYDGDGKYELCVFRPFGGQWLEIKLDFTGLRVRTMGQPGDTAFPGNFVGGPEADRAVFRRGTWYIEDGITSVATQVSTGGRMPLTLDWNGDGYQDLAFFNEQNGGWGIQYGALYYATYFGGPGDVPVGR